MTHLPSPLYVPAHGYDQWVDFDCPRCHEHVTEVYFGPCGDCRQVLRASLTRPGRQIEVSEYELTRGAPPP